MIPKIIKAEINISEDVKIPEWYIEESIGKAFLSEIMHKAKIEYHEYDDYRASTVVGSVAIMSVEERDILINYIKTIEEEIDNLQKNINY